MSPIDVTQNELVVTQDIDFDKELKKKQITKIDLEITLLTKPWSRLLEVVHKIAVPVVAVASAVLAFALGIPGFEIKALVAQKEAKKAEKEAYDAKRATEAALKNLHQVERDRKAAEKDIEEMRAKEKERQNKLPATQQAALLAGQIAIHFKGELLRDDINRLREKLKAAGFTAPPAQRIDGGHGNEVRYFSDTADERDRAEQTGRIVQAFFASNNCPIADLKVNLHKLPAGERPPLQVWLNHSCRSVR